MKSRIKIQKSFQPFFSQFEAFNFALYPIQFFKKNCIQKYRNNLFSLGLTIDYRTQFLDL